MMSGKTFVLDTNVLLHDPNAFFQFPKNKVIIPLPVIEELDQLKRLPNELGKNSRTVIRILASLKDFGEGDLHKGVTIDNGSTIVIELNGTRKIDHPLSLSIKDNQIIILAYALLEQGERVIFVSKDFAARIKAEAMGIESRDYENLKVSYRSIYRGVRKEEVSAEQIDLFLKDGRIKLDPEEACPNEYCILSSPEKRVLTGKFNEKNGQFELLPPLSNVWGIKPLNSEQRCALDAILRDDIQLVTLVGPAGTGKTLIALAGALRKVFDEGVYNKVLISRPIVPLGKDIGYLPGTKEEKLYHWMQPIYDNLEYLCHATGGGGSDAYNWVLDSDRIEMEAVTYIRGRSLPKMFIIVDEAQNLTPHEVKTIISRAGEGTKVVLAGDPTQIDNPYLDQDSNGLNYVVSKFCDFSLYGHLFLEKTERSQLAALAAEVM